MMGERMAMQDRLFYEFRLEEHVPAGYLLRIIDRFVDPEAAEKADRLNAALRAV